MKIPILLVIIFILGPIAKLKSEEMWVYFGTYTRDKESQGIYVSKLNLENGILSKPSLAATGDNPSFVTILPNKEFLVSVEETNDYQGESSGSLASYKINHNDGTLKLIDRLSTRGGAPCHISADQSGKHVFFANYVGGSIGTASVSVEGKLKLTSFVQHKGGSILPRQKSPHSHSIDIDPSGKYVVCADLGLDKVMIYNFDAVKGELKVSTPGFARVAPGNGPRHFSFSPNGKYGYTNNEITSSVTVFDFNSSSGTMKNIQTLSTLPKSHENKNSTAELLMHPSGKFLYCSNRGHDSVAVFKADENSGKLSLVEVEVLGVKTPRGFGIDPTGKYLIAGGQNSNDVRVYKIDGNTGEISPVGEPVSVPCPVCVQFLHPPLKEYNSIFDGKTMNGWEGSQDWFRIEKGAIVAGNLEKKIPKNQFLVTKESFSDFDLKFKAKLLGEGKNAGVQFWSERVPNHHEMIGFQCDIGSMADVSIWGALYDESRRRKFLTNVPTPTQKVTKFDGWNDFRIRAQGDIITIWINGALATRYFEKSSEEKVPRSGRFGLQIHSGLPAEAWYKDIQIKEL
ncbi:beta-propeller fold lactonase family protein [Verrucomicrobiales bacterium]|nr:beta-propeller fold lactonase family protein [Verrucomicrobiales bacterium]